MLKRKANHGWESANRGYQLEGKNGWTTKFLDWTDQRYAGSCVTAFRNTGCSPAIEQGFQPVQRTEGQLLARNGKLVLSSAGA